MVPNCEPGTLPGSSTEPLRGASFRLGGFFFSIFWWRVRLEGTEKTDRDTGDSIDRSLESRLVSLRWLAETADLSYKLERGSSNLFVCDRRFEIEQGFNIPAQGWSPGNKPVLGGRQFPHFVAERDDRLECFDDCFPIVFFLILGAGRRGRIGMFLLVVVTP
jgi:hypothetical protein